MCTYCRSLPTATYCPLSSSSCGSYILCPSSVYNLQQKKSMCARSVWNKVMFQMEPNLKRKQLKIQKIDQI